MAYKIDGSDYTKSWSIECSVAATVDHPLLAICLERAANLNALVPLASIEVAVLSPPDVDSFSFTIKDKNGRKWNQIIRMDQVTDPQMCWKHNSFWRRSEFVLIDLFRSALTELIQSIKPTAATVTFG